jgi:hypothetical protein
LTCFVFCFNQVLTSRIDRGSKNGHEIENFIAPRDCISLHHEIENFIRNGKLVRFLVEEWSQGRGLQEPLQIAEALGKRQDYRVVCQRHDEEPRMARTDHQNPWNQDMIGEIHMIYGGLAG